MKLHLSIFNVETETSEILDPVEFVKEKYSWVAGMQDVRIPGELPLTVNASCDSHPDTYFGIVIIQDGKNICNFAASLMNYAQVFLYFSSGHYLTVHIENTNS